MASVREPLDRALRGWWRDHAREELARWRGDADASSVAVRTRRHAALAGPGVRDAFLESHERGLLPASEIHALADWLRRAMTAPARLAARRDRLAWSRAAVPHDSDWHSLETLMTRIEREPRVRERRALSRSVSASMAEGLTLWARRRERLEESAEKAAWLTPFLPLPEAPTEAPSLASTNDAWHELRERLAHAANTTVESWEDVLFVLRAPRLDDAVPARRRWRRIAEGLGPLRPPLAEHARAEPEASLGHGLLVVRERVDVRVHSGRERGVFSEREACLAMGRAFAAVTTHPATPESLARPRQGAVGWLIGALLAHRLAEPSFVDKSLGLEGRPRRAVAELALGIELAEARVHAAWRSVEGHVGDRDFPERARAALVHALGVDVTEAAAALTLKTHRPERGRALSLAPRVYVSLREQVDEDWWRNPRAEEVLRSATAHGDAGTVAGLLDGLPPIPDDAGPRIAELLG
ncbi:MAG: hypothetical protein AB8I08_13300 [Sandaracinaceae bacterium]